MTHCDDILALQQKADQIRADIVRAAYECGRMTHPGPSLSIADICTALYYKFMNVDPRDPQKSDRDRLVLSKGHGTVALYAILADLGFFPKEELLTLRHVGSILQGHPDMKKTPGIDMTSGSLGNGLGIALGMAYQLKYCGKTSKVYCILGDGEMNEGTVWEAINQAPVMNCDNLIAFVDMNGWQSSGTTAEICPMLNMKERFETFGWKAFEINGHDMPSIVNTLDIAVNSTGQPVCIVANTVKGKGVSYMENDNAWHQKVVTRELYEQAMKEFGVQS